MSIALRKGRALSRQHQVMMRRQLRVPEEDRLSWPQRVLSLATLAAVAAVLGLLAWIALGMAAAPREARRAGSRSVSMLSAQALDPRLLVQPRTMTQVATADGLRLALVVQPVLPGPNRLMIALADHGRAVAGAHVQVVATMREMLMRPVQLEARTERGGRYRGTAPRRAAGPCVCCESGSASGAAQSRSGGT